MNPLFSLEEIYYLPFPTLFNRVLSHPDVTDVLREFNRASHAYGRHVASAKVHNLHPDIDVSALPYLNHAARDDMIRASSAF